MSITRHVLSPYLFRFFVTSARFAAALFAAFEFKVWGAFSGFKSFNW
jgi:hypothetical protein